MHEPMLRHARRVATAPNTSAFAFLEAIMYSHSGNNPGCPSGQRERTVNPSRKLRWFKSNTWNN